MTRTKHLTRAHRGLRSLAVLTGALFAPEMAHAADEFVARPLTLPPLNFAFDVGLGIAHTSRGAGETGPGMNLEGAVGLTRNLELGFRTGIRANLEGRDLQADQFGRLYDTETFGTGGDTLANPEFRLTGRIYAGDVTEIALEGRVYMPFERGTYFGGMFAVPMHFRLARILRLDTGGELVTIIPDRDFRPILGIPLRVWFQPGDRFWIGPIAAFHHVFGTGANYDVLSLGGGLGYQATSFFDFKAQLLFPALNRDNAGTGTFGIGIGAQIRIE